jgi:ABC-type nitrate/sulfonate/bicarbonate transport system substrate-binding protein
MKSLSPRRSTRRILAAALATTVATVTLVACGTGDTSSPSTTESTTANTSQSLLIRAGEPIPAERCAANQAAGKITFLTGFDFAAAASIVEVIYAAELGYYRDLCLDVEILSSFSTANYPLVAGGQGQFASGGSFSEVVAFAAANQAELVAVMVAGSTPIDTLILKSDIPTVGPSVTAQDLAGATIGVKGKLPASIEVMLLRAGLRNDVDFTTVPVDGFDPTAHIAIPSIIGFPGWKSNEPGRLERENIAFVTLDPTEAQVPGSFGAIFTSRSFITAHPTAAEDFVRATLKGLEAAIADPTAAAEAAVALVIANGNPNFLSPEGEVFRWATEAALIQARTPLAMAAGTPNPDLLRVEVETYSEVGFFGPGITPDLLRHVDPSLAIGVTAPEGGVIWPKVS